MCTISRKDLSDTVAKVQRYFHSGAFICLLVFFVVGCVEPKEEPPAPPPPPPATADDLVANALQEMQALDLIPPGVPWQFLITPQGRSQLVSNLREWKISTYDEPEGQRAASRLQLDLQRRLREAQEGDNAALVILVCDLLEVLDPESERVPRYRQWAEARNNRPIVSIRGFHQPRQHEDESVIVLCEVYMPATGETHRINITEGEHFYGLEFIEIIGRYRGIHLRHLETGDRFDVMF